MSPLEWLVEIGKDANVEKAGFQARGVYVLLCVIGPVIFGATVALLLTMIEKIFGVRLSGKGGH